MAEFLHFSRDTKLYMEKDGYLWNIPVLDGFSFSQATNATEITLNEMEDASGRSRRGRRMFTDSLSAAEWSFSSYIRPFISAGSKSGTNGRADSNAHQHAVEEALWVAMAGQNVYVPGTGKFKHGATGGAISSLAVTGGGTDSDRTAGTYTVAVPTAASGTSTGVVVAGGTQQGGTGAVLQIVINGSGVAAVTTTERGTKFESNQTITVDSELIGGGANDDNLVVTVQSESFTSNATDLDINFFDSNRAAIGKFNLYFLLNNRQAGRLLYRLKDAVVNEASIDFDIDGIATINWSGFAGQIEEVVQVTSGSTPVGQVFIGDTNTPTAAAAGSLRIDTNDNDSFYIATGAGTSSWYHAIEEGAVTTTGASSTGNFIRNRLTQLTVAPETAFQAATTFTDAAGNTVPYETSYSVAITGGNVTIANNITFLTPEEIGSVNQPIEHVTGTRTVTGSLTCYLGASDTATNRSKDLFKDLVADTNTVINKFALNLAVGGSDITLPRFQIDIPTAHLEIPSHAIEDVISLETNFHGLGSGVGEGDEATLKYIGV